MYQQVFAPETFVARRRRVAERIGARAVAVVQGARGSGSHDQFRQSNELFYLCGVEVPHAYLLIHGADGTAALFLPHQDRHSVEAEGEHLSADNAERVRELTGAAGDGRGRNDHARTGDDPAVSSAVAHGNRRRGWLSQSVVRPRVAASRCTAVVWSKDRPACSATRS